MVEQTAIFIQRGVRCDGLSVFIDRLATGERWTATPLNFTKVELYAADGLPTFNLSNKETQHLMDQLWDCGLRPTAEVGTTKQVGALKNHLADLQKLVFKYDTKIKKGTE